MFKSIMSTVKETVTESVKGKADSAIIEAAKAALIKAAVDNKIAINELLTPSIEEKFNELAKTILAEHGYTKLVKIGLLSKFTK